MYQLIEKYTKTIYRKRDIWQLFLLIDFDKEKGFNGVCEDDDDSYIIKWE